jgi:hypothetical protein
MVAHNPLNRSGRADFPHPALASGDDAEAAQRIRMMDARNGQPAVSNPQHPVPEYATVLAAPRQCAILLLRPRSRQDILSALAPGFICRGLRWGWNARECQERR